MCGFKFFALSILCILFHQNARADILFLDFNLSESEISTAKNIADQRGETLVVFPEVSQKIRSYIDESEIYKKTLTQKIFKCKQNKECVLEYYRLYQKTSQEQADVLAKIPFNLKELNDLLDRQDQAGRHFSVFIESGHAGYKRFQGLFQTTIKHEDLARVLDGRRSLQSVKSTLYWGCYSMTIGAVKNRWPQLFPKAQIIAGFDRMAPSSEKFQSAKILEYILTHENEAIEAGVSVQKLKDFFKSIPYTLYSSFSVSINYKTYVSNNNQLLMADAGNICRKHTYAEYSNVINCFAKAQSVSCANPPSDTSNGILRTSYTQIQNLDHCFDPDIAAFNPEDRIDIEFALRLIFFTNIKINYAHYHNYDLKQFNNHLLEEGVPEDLQLSNLASLSRAEIVYKMNALNEIKSRLSPLLQNAIQAIFNSLIVLQPDAIPQSWIESTPREGIPEEYDKFRM